MGIYIDISFVIKKNFFHVISKKLEIRIFFFYVVISPLFLTVDVFFITIEIEKHN